MRGELVALDLETTGLDAGRDSIIEIGAVYIKDGQIGAEFSTLVNPGTPIPANITHITGIRSEDVASAPDIQTVLPRIQAFIGSRAIIGHNINFDIGFFRPLGILQDNPRIDTYDLASILLPRAARYNLNSLTNEVGIQLENAHRALDDARASALLYWVLWQKMLSLPRPTLEEITSAAKGIQWDTGIVFEAALQETTKLDSSVHPELTLFEPYTAQEKPLVPKEIRKTINLDELEAVIGESGRFANQMPGYEYRPQQIQMTQAIANAFNHNQHLMIEAGTGTGKSLAYLLPAILWSTRNDERVVISTNTINLQEQLITKDIPTIEQILDTSFKACIIKGRGNYLCPRRLSAIRRRRPTSTDELRTLAKILVWLLESKTGDRSEISLRGPVENNTWQRLSAQDEDCTLNRCLATTAGACPFYKARKTAELAHIVIVNHALLVSDALNDNRVLPEYRYAVVDEAHQLEDAVTNAQSLRLDSAALQRRLADLGTPSKGLLGDLLNSATGSLPEKELKKLRVYIQHISEASALMIVHIEALFKGIYTFLVDNKAFQAGDYVSQILITNEHRSKTGFTQLQGIWGTLDEFFDALSYAMSHLTDALNNLKSYNIPSYDDLVNSTSAAAQYLSEARRHLNGFILSPDANTIYWVSIGQYGADSLAVNTAPLHVGPIIEKSLWNANDSVILTSATLRTQDSFDYMRERLYADRVETIEVGSPFNYHDSTLLYIPDDLPEPTNRHAYQQHVERGIVELAAALNGRVLALFTSYTQLRQTAQAISPRLALGNITVYDQSDGSSRQTLLDGFKSTEKAVLLGTKSFWEGVDIPGDSLSALVIVRLPFAVPTDPIFAARSETYTNSFNEYAVPDAVLRFRQGFGRLIRSQTDRGIVTIFDNRVLTKNYGAAFLTALPDCTTQYGPLNLLPEAAKNWLKRS